METIKNICLFRPEYILIVLILSFLLGCESEKQINIGLVGGLTGRHSDLGIYGRNGVILAIEEVNKNGGINQQLVNLIIKDDKQDPATAIRVVKELVDEKVIAIIGHFTSTMSMVSVPTINREKVVMISPTTATNELTELDDYFIRVMSPSRAAIEYLAKYSFDVLNLKNVVVIYDVSNQAFSKAWYSILKEQAGQRNGTKVVPMAFTSNSSVRFSELVQKVLAKNPDGILIAAASLDTAMICQQLKKLDSNARLLSTMWAMTDDFIQHAGSAAEGVIFAHWFYEEYRSKASERFRHAYLNRFNHKPNFASYFGYEAAQVLIKSLSLNLDPVKLKETIIRKRVFKGIQGEITIDQYGDPLRKFFLMSLKDGKFLAIND